MYHFSWVGTEILLGAGKQDKPPTPELKNLLKTDSNPKGIVVRQS